MDHNRSFSKVALVGVIALLLAGVQTAMAIEVIEQYSGFAIAMGSAATGAKSTVSVGIYRWSTDAERDNFVQILKDKGPAALNKAMFDAEQVAFLKVSNSMGYKLRLAREYKNAEGKRVLRFAADRPITFGESARNSRTKDYDFTIIELVIDAEGKGEGTLSLGTEIAWNAEQDKLELKGYSSEPMRIMNVNPVKIRK